MEKLTPQARKLLAGLDAELAAVSAARGERLSWSVGEVQLREILAATIDRRADMSHDLGSFCCSARTGGEMITP